MHVIGVIFVALMAVIGLFTTVSAVILGMTKGCSVWWWYEHRKIE